MSRGRAAALGVLLLAGFAPVATAHEPVHSIGPNIGWTHLTAIEVVGSASWADRLWHGGHDDDDPSRTRLREGDLQLHVAHVLAPDWLVFVDAPLTWREVRSGGHTDRAWGGGDARLGGKWRFWRRQAPARTDQAALFAAVSLPTGRRSSEPPLGSAQPDLTLGVTAGRDALFLYLWGNTRVRLPMPAGRYRAPWGLAGNVAIGTRLWEPELRGVDLVPLFEVGARFDAPSRTRGHTDRDTGGARITCGPSVLFFFHRFEFKGGLQWTAWRHARGRQYVPEFELVLGVGVLL